MIKKTVSALCLAGLAGGMLFGLSDAHSATLGGQSGHGWPNNFTTCRAIRNDQNNGGFLTAAVSTSSTSYATLNLGSLSIPAGDTLSFECNVAPVSGSCRGSVLNVNWTGGAIRAVPGAPRSPAARSISGRVERCPRPPSFCRRWWRCCSARSSGPTPKK